MKTKHMHIVLLIGVFILFSHVVNGAMEPTEVDMKSFVEKMWTGEFTIEEAFEQLARIPVDQLPRLLATYYRSPHSNPEGLDIAFGVIVAEFSKRMDAEKWREIVHIILKNDEYPRKLKTKIAGSQFHAKIMDNDIESIIDMLEDAVKPVDDTWVYAQRAIALALRSSRSAALRSSNVKAVGRVEYLAEKQVRSIMNDLLRLGIRDDAVYRLATATTLAMYRLIVPPVFESEIIEGISNANLGVSKELRILESMYRSPSYSPSESGPVWNRIKELERKADLQQIDLTDEDRRRIDVILAE